MYQQTIVTNVIANAMTSNFSFALSRYLQFKRVSIRRAPDKEKKIISELILISPPKRKKSRAYQIALFFDDKIYCWRK
jgi:hypothetical protein